MTLSKAFVELDKSLHERTSFDCGEKELNDFIAIHAAKHMRSGISRTLVLPATSVCANHKRQISAFYSIAASTIERKNLPESLAKKLPRYPVPVFLIAQLAVHNDCRGTGLGKLTLRQALKHLWQINTHMRAYAIIVDCLTPAAESFYQKFGFEELIVHRGRTRLFMRMTIVEQLFGESKL